MIYSLWRFLKMSRRRGFQSYNPASEYFSLVAGSTKNIFLVPVVDISLVHPEELAPYSFQNVLHSLMSYHDILNLLYHFCLFAYRIQQLFIFYRTQFMVCSLLHWQFRCCQSLSSKPVARTISLLLRVQNNCPRIQNVGVGFWRCQKVACDLWGWLHLKRRRSYSFFTCTLIILGLLSPVVHSCWLLLTACGSKREFQNLLVELASHVKNSSFSMG